MRLAVKHQLANNVPGVIISVEDIVMRQHRMKKIKIRS